MLLFPTIILPILTCAFVYAINRPKEGESLRARVARLEKEVARINPISSGAPTEPPNNPANLFSASGRTNSLDGPAPAPPSLRK